MDGGIVSKEREDAQKEKEARRLNAFSGATAAARLALRRAVGKVLLLLLLLLLLALRRAVRFEMTNLRRLKYIRLGQ